MKILTTPKMERCIGCYSCSLMSEVAIAGDTAAPDTEEAP